jgi:ketosteroid isomerase-like protein
MPFESPQDAEDAFYDALENGDAKAMSRIWETSGDIACLLPMTPLIRGAEVLEMWRSMFAQGAAFDIQVRHLTWIEGEGLALHLIEERITVPPDPANGRPSQPAPPIYASNLFRRGADGWRLVVHQNSPVPPPPGVVPPGPDRERL